MLTTDRNTGYKIPANCDVVAGLSSNTRKSRPTAYGALSFRRTQRNERLRKIRIARCCQEDFFSVENFRFCSEPFVDDCLQHDLCSELLELVKSRRILRDEALPSRRLPYSKNTSLPVKSSGRERRAERCRTKALLSDIFNQESAAATNGVSSNQSPSNTSNGLPPPPPCDASEAENGCVVSTVGRREGGTGPNATVSGPKNSIYRRR